jgi:hypothetical protein
MRVIPDGGTVYSFTAIPKSSNGYAIPPGSGITGHILIQIVDGNGVARDVTTDSQHGDDRGRNKRNNLFATSVMGRFHSGKSRCQGLSNAP